MAGTGNSGGTNALAATNYSGYGQKALPTDFNVNTSAATGVYNAGNTMAQEAGYQPSQIGAPTTAQLGLYTNPWETSVVDQSLADLERSRLTAQNIGGANAGAANAFGGSRQGVAEAETNRA